MEKNEMKTGIELKKLLTLNLEGNDYKSVLSIDENEDFFPELTKEFDNLKKESESSTRNFGDRIILFATTLLENLAKTALNEIEKRVDSIYNEGLEVQRVLYKVFAAFYKKGLENLSDIKEFNKESAIALRSVIPQLRKIINIYSVPLEKVIERRTKGGYLLKKIEQVQDIIACLKKNSMNFEIYMDYEKIFLCAYILAKRIEEGDTLFNIDGFSSKIEKICRLLESEGDITHLLNDMSLNLFSHTLSGEANYICLKLRVETLSTKRAFNIIKNHHHSSYLPESLEVFNKLEQFRKEMHAMFKGTNDHVEEKSEGIEKNLKELNANFGQSPNSKKHHTAIDLRNALDAVKYKGKSERYVRYLMEYNLIDLNKGVSVDDVKDIVGKTGFNCGKEWREANEWRKTSKI